MTIDNLKALQKEFLKFTETAEQHKFPLLVVVNEKLNHSIENFESMSIEEKKAMFRVVCKIIGKNFLKYK